MRKKFFIYVAIIMICVCIACAFVACDTETGTDSQHGSGNNSDDSNNIETPDNNEEKNTFRVVFDSRNDSPEIVEIVKQNSRVNEPRTPVKEGYAFIAWKNLEDNSEWNFNLDTVTSDIVLYAEWIKKVTISFVCEGKTLAQKQALPGESVSIFIPTESKYYFYNWYREPACRTAVAGSITANDDMTLWGKLMYKNEFDDISANLKETVFNTDYVYNIATQKIVDAKVNFYFINYFYVYLQAGDCVTVATKTSYLNMNKNLLISLDAGHDMIFENGMSCVSWWKRESPYDDTITFKFQVNKTGRYALAVTVSPDSSLAGALKNDPNYYYVYSICAKIEHS